MKTEIIGWNPINDGCGVLKASVYVKPSLDMLRFFNRSVLHRGVVRVTGTGSCYDGPDRFATIDKSADVPNCRQNFFNGTGLYVITLDTKWQGYPMKNGTIEFVEGLVNQIIQHVNPYVPTSEPTSAPTSAPTLAPTSAPPTSGPTSAPTSSGGEIGENVENYEMLKNKKCGGMDTTALALAGLVILFFLCTAMIPRR
jgi:hypothetical protein